MKPYSTTTPLEEAIEIRFDRAHGQQLVLSAWVTPAGTIGYKLAASNVNVAQSLVNLQTTSSFPAKAVPGWQREVMLAAGTGLYTIAEVR